MSAISRFFLPASRRTYSSYFSSKPGGGRYFNSAKAPKNAVVAAKTNSKADAPSEVQQDNIKAASTPSSSANASSVNDAQSPSSPNAPTSGASEELKASSPEPTDLSNAFAEFTQNHIPQLSITSKDFKTHQFFSLHRPLLLISQPSTIFREVPSNLPLFSSLKAEAEQSTQPNYGLGGPVDPFIDADAEAARQLTRALTLSKAGSTLAWENTLRHLGLDVNKEADRVNLQQQFDKEWEEVLLDSTKRKRRKKMKKHKLKKRRRATRAERMRLNK